MKKLIIGCLIIIAPTFVMFGFLYRLLELTQIETQAVQPLFNKYAWTDVQEVWIMTRFENIEVVCYSFDLDTLSCFPNSKPK
jgi:hypothetical protein